MSNKPLTVREACKRGTPLDGADAQALEHALTITERERDEVQERCDSLLFKDLPEWKKICGQLRKELGVAQIEIARTDHPRAVYSRCQLFSQQDCVGCGCVICGDNENPLVKQIKQLEQKRDEVEERFGGLYLDFKKVERERDAARTELVHARDGIDEACTQNRELALQLELLGRSDDGR